MISPNGSVKQNVTKMDVVIQTVKIYERFSKLVQLGSQPL